MSCAEMSISLRSGLCLGCSGCRPSRYRMFACRFIMDVLFNEIVIGVDEAVCSTDCCRVVMTGGKLEYCVT